MAKFILILEDMPDRTISISVKATPDDNDSTNITPAGELFDQAMEVICEHTEGFAPSLVHVVQ